MVILGGGRGFDVVFATCGVELRWGGGVYNAKF
jgi:hypothetical protein